MAQKGRDIVLNNSTDHTSGHDALPCWWRPMTTPMTNDGDSPAMMMARNRMNESSDLRRGWMIDLFSCMRSDSKWWHSSHVLCQSPWNSRNGSQGYPLRLTTWPCCLGKFSYSAFAKSPEWIASMMARVSYTFRMTHRWAQVDRFAIGLKCSLNCWIIKPFPWIPQVTTASWYKPFPIGWFIIYCCYIHIIWSIFRVVLSTSMVFHSNTSSRDLRRSFKLMRWPAPKAPPVHPVLMSQAFTLCLAILGHGQKAWYKLPESFFWWLKLRRCVFVSASSYNRPAPNLRLQKHTCM